MRRIVLALVPLFIGCSSHFVTPGDASKDAATSSDQAVGGDLALLDGAPADGPIASRPYAMNLHVPPGYSAKAPAPLLILLHGYSATGQVQESYFHLTAVSDAHGFLYVYPDGNVDPSNNHFWNATDACCDFYGAKPDDVGYLDAIVDDVEAKYNVDRKRIFLVGHSNGGFMAHRLACDSADRFAGIVALAGETWKDQSHCQPSGPVSVLEVQGTADATVPYGGGAISTNGPPAPGAVETVGDWAKLDHCSGALAATGQTLDLDTTLAGAETQVSAYSGCPSGAVELWTINGGGHIPALQTNPSAMPTWGELIYGWLSAHPKP